MITSEERRLLVQQMKDLLYDYDYSYNVYALEKIVDKWAENKANLIEAFKKHPNYLEGKFMIAFDADFDREISNGQSVTFRNWLLTIYDDIKDNFPTEVIEGIKESNVRWRERSFVSNENENPYKFPHFLDDFIWSLEHFAKRTLDEDVARKLDAAIPNAHIHANEKTSRAVNKICTYLGFAKHPNYNKEFAKYADSLSPLKIKRHTILSINPLDYLLMSNGNSWSSCHGIDDDGGCYSSGTISYMLDRTSMVFYTVDSSYNGNEYYNERKITRQMYHYAEEKLIQGRLYPQSNDLAGRDPYDEYRAIVQKIVSELFGFHNRWKLTRGTNAISNYTYSSGTHYRDYRHFDQCTISRVRDSENENAIYIGHEPICIECGSYHDVEESINCCNVNGRYTCECCGARIDEDDVCWVGDDAYCDGCATYCDCCGEYAHNEDVTWIESERRYVCDHCRDNYYFYCDECGEWENKDDMYYIESENIYVCHYCRHNEFERCNECGELFRNADIEMYDSDWYCTNCLEDIKAEEENEEEAV